MRLELDLDFGAAFAPEQFFFGVANAPYLSEGGFNTPGGMQNSYGVLEASGRVPPSGEATRFWTEYARDISLAASHGLTAFRMGVDWSRVQPSASLVKTTPPPWDSSVAQHYAGIIGCIADKGMLPIVTLHHFAHPAWAGLDFWQDTDGPDMLVGYMLRVTEEINDALVGAGHRPMPNLILFNELNLVPMIYHTWANLFPTKDRGEPAMMKALDIILSRYIVAYDGIKDLYDRKGWVSPEIGFGVATAYAYEVDKFLYDIVRLRQFGIAREGVDDAIAGYKRQWMARIAPLVASKLTDAERATWHQMCGTANGGMRPSDFTRTLDALYRSGRNAKLDNISCNIYEPFAQVRGVNRPSRMLDFWEFTVDSDIYGTFIRCYNDGNTDLPVYLGENGLITRQPLGQKAEPRPDGQTRESYFKAYFMEMVRCIRDGVPIRGYLFWSLLDDFEWQDGFTPRCGLYGYDYARHEVLPLDAMGQPAADIYAALIAALRSADKSRIAAAFMQRHAHQTGSTG